MPSSGEISAGSVPVLRHTRMCRQPSSSRLTAAAAAAVPAVLPFVLSRLETQQLIPLAPNPHALERGTRR